MLRTLAYFGGHQNIGVPPPKKKLQHSRIKIMRRHFVLLFSLIILFANCINSSDNFQKENPEIMIDFNKIPEQFFTTNYNLASTKVIQLENTDSTILSDNLIVNKTTKGFMAFDRVTSQLYHFTNEGKLINTIGSLGGASHEYTSVLDIHCNNETERVHILCNSGNTIKVYNYSGEHIENISTPINSSSFSVKSNDSYYLYSGFSFSQNGRVHLCEKQKLIKSFLPINTKAIDLTENNFNNFNNTHYFRELLLPSIFLIDSGNIREFIRIDYGNKTILQGDLEQIQDPFAFFEAINRKGFYSTIEFYKNHKKVLIRSLYQKNSKNNDQIIMYDLLGDMNDTTFVKVIADNTIINDLMANFTLISIDSTNIVYFTVSAPYLHKAIEHFALIYEKEAFDIDGNPLIIALPLFNNNSNN